MVIFQYCERIATGLWVEPANLISNLAFLLAACIAWRHARRAEVSHPTVTVLLWLIVTVAVGSAIFHMFATAWAKALDLAPIFVFQLIFLWAYLRLHVRASAPIAAIAVSINLVFSLALLNAPQYLNGSILYLPTVLVLVAIATFHCRSRQPGRLLPLAATLCFLAALVARSIDLWSCPFLPTGTHFLWHVLNGGVLYLVTMIIITKLATGRAAYT